MEQKKVDPIVNFFNRLPRCPMEDLTGRTPQTTYWQDFSIADVFVLNGKEPDAVKDTHHRSWTHVRNSTPDILAEYVLVLNWKIWEHWERGNHDLGLVYDDIWRRAHDWACKHLQKDDLTTYLRIID